MCRRALGIVKPGANRADHALMRARLVFKLIAIVVFLILSALGARACTGSSSPSSPVNPVNVARNGIAGICANQQAVAQNDGSDQSPGTALSPSELAQQQASDPAGVNALQQALGGSITCPTETTVANGG